MNINTKIIKNKKVIMIAVAVFVAVYYLLMINNFLSKSFHRNDTVKVMIGGNTFRLEAVETNQKIKDGLGGRFWMCNSCGMLFDFKTKGSFGFWMKDMNFPIDIIWTNSGEIVWIEKSVSQKDPFKTYDPRVTSDIVIELKAGTTEKYDIKRGDKIYFQ